MKRGTIFEHASKIYYQSYEKKRRRKERLVFSRIIYFQNSSLINQKVFTRAIVNLGISISTFYHQINKKKKRITSSDGQKNIYEQKSTCLTSPILQNSSKTRIDEEKIQFQSFNPLIIGIIGGKRVRRIIERLFGSSSAEKNNQEFQIFVNSSATDPRAALSQSFLIDLIHHLRF